MQSGGTEKGYWMGSLPILVGDSCWGGIKKYL